LLAKIDAENWLHCSKQSLILPVSTAVNTCAKKVRIGDADVEGFSNIDFEILGATIGYAVVFTHRIERPSLTAGFFRVAGVWNRHSSKCQGSRKGK